MELTAWAQILALDDHPARRWEPERLRLRVFSAAGRLVNGGDGYVFASPGTGKRLV
jgi:hypothetical protein